MEEEEVVALRKELQTQSATLGRLYAELEEERRAASSGAQEALAMIARLQEEKAAAKMEASHYRRIAEEKLQHADESLAILREFMFQKEMEIVSLKYHLQNYKQLLSVMRIDDRHSFGGGRTFSRKESLARHISLPATPLEELSSFVSDGISVGADNVMQFTEDYDLAKLHDFIQFTRPEKGDARRRSTRWSPVVRKIKEKKLKSYDDFQVMTSTFIPVKIQEMPGCSWCTDDTVTLNEPSILRTRSAVCSLTLQENHYGCSHCGAGNHFKSNCINKKLNSSEEEAMNDYLLEEDNLNEALGKAPIICHPSASDFEDEITAPETNLGQLKKQMQQLEDDMRRMKQEDLERGREQTQLLGRMMEHLGAARPHTTSTDVEKNQENGILMTCLAEVLRLLQFACLSV